MKLKITNQQLGCAKMNYQKGQTLLMLLIFMIIAITVTSAATTLILVNAGNTQKLEGGTMAYHIAESGIENALLRLLRNPNYTGETLSIGGGMATISITGNIPSYSIISVGHKGNFSRSIQVVVIYNGNMTISSWKEVFQ